MNMILLFTKVGFVLPTIAFAFLTSDGTDTFFTKHSKPYNLKFIWDNLQTAEMC